ncbi:MCE family protein [Mycolicibacterium sp. CBM1]
MITRTRRIQLIVFSLLTVIALAVLLLFYVGVPALLGIGRYSLYADLPSSGGLYATANVTYRGTAIGRVTAVRPTKTGVRATMSIRDDVRIPTDASANVHSVSALGEQYIDLVSIRGNTGSFLADGQVISDTTVPSEIGQTLDSANRALAALPSAKISSLLDETSSAVGGLGPSMHRLVDATQAIAEDFKDNVGATTDLIDHSGPILDSQVDSRDAIERWAANLRSIANQAAQQDSALRGGLEQAAPTLQSATAVFKDLGDALPQVAANLAIVFDMLKRYHAGLEQVLVFAPQGASIAQTSAGLYPGKAVMNVDLNLNEPPPCLTGFLPANKWRSPADTSVANLSDTTYYCKIPKDTPANAVRGARNFPCQDVPGKRAATPAECHSGEPYSPLGTNPWYGDPNQSVTCPAPAARCDQPVKPGVVIPAPSIDSGLNPAPADQLPQPPTPISDPLTDPGAGSVQCSGQQPSQCTYTPSLAPTGLYSPQNGLVVAPDGTRFTLSQSPLEPDDGWKDMLGPGAA